MRSIAKPPCTVLNRWQRWVCWWARTNRWERALWRKRSVRYGFLNLYFI